MTLGEKILNFRAKNNLTQQQFSEAANISKMTVIHIENEKGCSKIMTAKINNFLEENK